MLSVKDIVLNILLEKAALTNKLNIGTTIVDVEITEILDIILNSGLTKSKSSVNKAIFELKKESIIFFDSSQRSKIKQIIIDNILFYSVCDNDKNTINFNFNNDYLDQLINYMYVPLSCLENINLFNKSFIDMSFYIEKFKSGLKSVSNANKELSQIIIIDVDRDRIDTGLYGENSFLIGSKIFGPPKKEDSEFPQNLRNFRKNCGISKLMYVLCNKNSMYSKYLIEYSTLYSKFPQFLRKFHKTEKMIVLDTSLSLCYKTEMENPKMPSLIIKSRDIYNKTQKIQNNGGEDLFGTSSENWKNIEEVKRNYNQIPTTAYKTFEWFYYTSDLYEKVNKKKYPRTRNGESMMLANKVYPMIFGNLKWSAEDFKNYIYKSLGSNNKNKREKFFIGFLVSNEIRLRDIDDFTKEQKLIRKNDYFENMIYLPHIPILSEEEMTDSPLDKIIQIASENEAATIYNYGICNYHRYLQLCGLTMEQATLHIANFFKNEIIENILKKDREIALKYITGVAKNTIAWEPYSENNDCRPARNVLNWRENFSKLWKNKDIDITINPWWSSHTNYSLLVIPSIKKFFASTKKVKTS